MGWSPIGFLAGCLLVASVGWADPRSFQYDSASGQWIEAQTRQAAQTLADPFLDRMQQLYDARQYAQVHDGLVDWLKKNPKAPDRDRAILLLAQFYFINGDRMWCFFQCDELLENFPDSKLFFPALELQYRVADAFLNGFKKKFLGLPIQEMEDPALDMLFRIQERAPGSPIAERSLLRTADYYYRKSEFDLAADAYGAYLRIYPRGTEVARSRLRQAYSNFAQFRGPPYDATTLLDARTQFGQIQSQTPDLAREEGVEKFIERIDELLAAKIHWDADYYNRVGDLKGAVFLYRSLVQRFPNSKDAQAAKATLAKMPASALKDPWPPESAGQIPIPTTRPTLGP